MHLAMWMTDFCCLLLLSLVAPVAASIAWHLWPPPGELLLIAA